MSLVHNSDKCERDIHRFVQVAVCQCGKQGSGPYRAEGRTGLVTVYDSFGQCLGCMGEDFWNQLITHSGAIYGTKTEEEPF